MKILLICKSEYRYWFPALADLLRSQFGCNVDGLTFTGPSARMMEATGAFQGVHNLASHLKKFVREHELEECIRSLQETGFAETLNTMVYADRIIKQYPFERVVKIMAGIVSFWTSLLAELRPDAIVGEVSCATEWVGHSIAKDLNVPYLFPSITPLGNRVFFDRAVQGHWEAAELAYREINRKGLTSEQAKLAHEFLQQFRTKKTKPPFLAGALRSPLHLNADQIAKRLKRIPFRLQTYLEDGYFEVGSYHGRPPWEPVLHDALRLARHSIYENLVFKRTIPQGRKVYFPLHMQPEYTTDVRAPFFTNQAALVENIARSVPMGYRVMVKEHPAMKGERRLSYYRQFREFYNVDLVSPSVDSHDLILGSDVSLTITGTTAWESILYERPVIAFGPLCYGYFELVYKCENVFDLPGLIAEAIKDFRPNQTQLLKFIWSVLSTAHTFLWGDALSNPGIASKENLERIAKSILFDVKSAAGSETDCLPVCI